MKALLVGEGEGPGVDILLQLEAAISRGDHRYAATLAKELAKVKISSRLTEQEDRTATLPPPVKTIKANMYVEDAVSAQGPIVLVVAPSITVAELKLQVEQQFEIPTTVQKWILDKSLVSEDGVTLSSQGVDKDGAQIYLYLVSPEEAKEEIVTPPSPPTVTPQKVPSEPIQKGRYWNYEEDRWSICNSDEDEDEEIGEKKIEVKNPDAPRPSNFQFIAAPKTPEKDAEPVKDAEIAAEAEDPAGEDVKADDYEWEYYYEEDNAQPNVENNANDKVKPDIEKLVANHIENRNEAKKDEGAVLVKEEVDGWECPVCTLRNPLERPGCQACTTERPANLGAGAVQEVKEDVKEKKEIKEKNLDAYKQLENLDIIPNAETFECAICFLEIEPGDGVVLRECLHTFCKLCLAETIEHSDAPKVKCPFKDEAYSCDMDLLEREIKALVTPAVLEKHQKKSVKEAEANIKNAFHCKTPDCAGWTVIEDNINIFKCPLCKRTNCITCQAVHDGMDCKQYQQYTLNDAQDENSKKTREWIQDLVNKGEALNCPSCQVLLLKKWGCDWVRCTYCRTEICWVTKQLRWGPGGRGDTSGGCKCMIDGRTKCHKMCNYCH